MFESGQTRWTTPEGFNANDAPYKPKYRQSIHQRHRFRSCNRHSDPLERPSRAIDIRPSLIRVLIVGRKYTAQFLGPNRNGGRIVSATLTQPQFPRRLGRVAPKNAKLWRKLFLQDSTASPFVVPCRVLNVQEIPPYNGWWAQATHMMCSKRCPIEICTHLAVGQSRFGTMSVGR